LALSKFSGQNVGENLVTFKKTYLAAVTKSRDRDTSEAYCRAETHG